MNIEQLQIGIGQLSNIAKQHATDLPELVDELAKLPDEINSFVLYVPWLGVFSVGKSSLINKVIGENVLPEDQVPTTAIATEIHYGSKKKLLVVDADGHEEELDQLPKNKEEANQDLFSKYSYAKCYIPSEQLQALNGIVLVDMPGIDSGIERHTEALFQYLGRGEAFVVVLDAGSGTVPLSLTTVLEELQLTSTPVIVLLNKSDKYSPSRLQSVQEEIELLLGDILDDVPQVHLTSRRYEESLDVITQSLNQIDIDQVRLHRFGPKFSDYVERLSRHVSMLLEGIELDTAELDRKILQAKRAKAEVNEALEGSRKKIHQELHGETLWNVRGELNQALVEELDVLCAMLERGKEGEDVFVSKVTSITHRVCSSSLERHVAHSFEGIITDVAESVALDDAELGNKIRASFKTTEHTLHQVAELLSTTTKLYRVVTTALAVLTSVVAPLIEIVLIFLPDILKFINQKNKREAIRNKVEDEIIPEIVERAISSIKSELPEIEKSLFEQVQKEFSLTLDEHRASLEACLREREGVEADHTAQVSELTSQIKEINALKKIFHDGEELPVAS